MKNTPYWFSQEEVTRIQELNQEYMEQKDIAEIVGICFRKPADREAHKVMNSSQILGMIQNEYPSVKNSHSTKVHIGLALKDLGFEHLKRGNITFYKFVPIRAA